MTILMDISKLVNYYVRLLSENVNTIKKNKETVLDFSQGGGLEIRAEKW
jgi:hypothetical protein